MKKIYNSFKLKHFSEIAFLQRLLEKMSLSDDMKCQISRVQCNFFAIAKHRFGIF